MKERVQKLMAQAGIGSRRACEELIEQGRVRVNGKVIQLGDQADPKTDTIEVDNVRLKLDKPKIYIAFHKPKNVLSTSVGHRGDERQTIRDFVPVDERLFSIGRLDVDSEGLMVLTNDGALANRLSHPRYQHTKTYRVVVYGLPSSATLSQWERGVYLDEEDGMTAPCSVRVTRGGKDISVLRVVMTEGKKRQIRRVAKMLGHPVKRLLRTHIGMLELGDLQPGQWRELTPREVKLLSTPSSELKALRQRSRREAQDGERPARRSPGRSETASGGERPARRRPVGDRARSTDDEPPVKQKRHPAGGTARTPVRSRPAGKRPAKARSQNSRPLRKRSDGRKQRGR